MTRCPLCAGLTHTALHGEYLRCTLCSLAFVPGRSVLPPLDAYRATDGVYRFENWNSWQTRVLRRLPPLVGQLPYFSSTAVRMFAAREGRRVTSLNSSAPWPSGTLQWRHGTILHAGIEDMRCVEGPDSRLTLGIIAAADAWDDVLALWTSLRGCAQDIAVALDTGDAGLAAACQAELAAEAPGRQCQVVSHPLDRDFAAQRNRVQQAATTDWVMQLDCDERLTARTLQLIPGILDDAEQQGWAAVAFTRNNLVDGVSSAFYPDVQYRLLRRAVRFTRAVHEYPELGPRQTAFVHLGAGIVHTLRSERFERRGAFYDGIEAGAARPHDTALLRQPLEPGVSVTP